jgi:hypothetical protein
MTVQREFVEMLQAASGQAVTVSSSTHVVNAKQ